MEFNVEWIDVGPYLEKQIQPTYLIERPLPESAQGDVKGGKFNMAQVARVGAWWVVVSDLATAQPQFALTKTGEHVRVPVFAYRTQQRALASIWGTGLQFGLRAIEALRLTTKDPIENCTLVLGHECHDLNDAFRCYVGMAFKVKE
jgi:hypothetical protein